MPETYRECVVGYQGERAPKCNGGKGCSECWTIYYTYWYYKELDDAERTQRA